MASCRIPPLPHPLSSSFAAPGRTTSRTSTSRCPSGALVIVTGVSGSGKSSLAFDTIYAEGQRRYVESLSAYARQFLERMEKPDVDRIEGICPAIAIRQKNSIRNPRSTVGTTTEIHDYMRLLWARVGHTYLPELRRRGQPRDGRCRLAPLGGAARRDTPAHRVRHARGGRRRTRRRADDGRERERRRRGRSPANGNGQRVTRGGRVGTAPRRSTASLDAVSGACSSTARRSRIEDVNAAGLLWATHAAGGRGSHPGRAGRARATDRLD